MDANEVIHAQMREFDDKLAVASNGVEPVMFCTDDFIPLLADNVFMQKAQRAREEFIAQFCADVDAGVAEVCGIQIRRQATMMQGVH